MRQQPFDSKITTPTEFSRGQNKDFNNSYVYNQYAVKLLIVISFKIKAVDNSTKQQRQSIKTNSHFIEIIRINFFFGLNDIVLIFGQ